MKTEPDLIDIYAMFALIGLMQKPIKGKSKIDIAYEAFEQARAMIDVREDFVNKGGD
jgi:tRNA (Thr-GGU) A37 N-methylase